MHDKSILNYTYNIVFIIIFFSINDNLNICSAENKLEHNVEDNVSKPYSVVPQAVHPIIDSTSEYKVSPKNAIDDIINEFPSIRNQVQANQNRSINNENGLDNTRNDIENQNKLFNTRITNLESDIAKLNASSIQDGICDTLELLINEIKTDVNNVSDKVETESVKVINDVEKKLDAVEGVIVNEINNATATILKDTTLLIDEMARLIEWLENVNNFEGYLEKLWERLQSEIEFFDLSEGIINAKCTSPDDLVAYRDNFTDNVLNILIQFAKWKDQCLLSIDKDLYDIDENLENNIDVALLKIIQDEVKALDPHNNIEARIFLTFLCLSFPTDLQDRLNVINDIISDELILDKPAECGIGIDQKAVIAGKIVGLTLQKAADNAPETWSVNVVGEGTDIPIPVKAIFTVLSGIADIAVFAMETKNEMREDCIVELFRKDVIEKLNTISTTIDSNEIVLETKLNQIIVELSVAGGLGNIKEGQDILLTNISNHEDEIEKRLQDSIANSIVVTEEGINTTIKSATDIINVNKAEVSALTSTMLSEFTNTNNRFDDTQDLIDERHLNQINQIITSSTHVIDVISEVAKNDIKDLSNAFNKELSDVKNTIVEDLLKVELEVDFRIDEDTENIILAVDDLQKGQDEIKSEIQINRTEITNEVKNTEALVQSTHDDTVAVIKQSAVHVIDSVTGYTEIEVNKLAKLTSDGLFDVKDTFIRDIENAFSSLENRVNNVEENIITRNNHNSGFILDEINRSESVLVNRNNQLEKNLINHENAIETKLLTRNDTLQRKVIQSVTESFTEVAQQYIDLSDQIIEFKTSITNNMNEEHINIQNHLSDISVVHSNIQNHLSDISVEHSNIQNHLSNNQIQSTDALLLLESNINDRFNDIHERINNLVFQLNLHEIYYIEEQLSANRPISSLYLPEQHGGKLNSVMGLVEESIKESSLAGMSVKTANLYYEQAQQKINKKQYIDAFSLLSKAYNNRKPLFSINGSSNDENQITPTPIEAFHTPVPSNMPTLTPTITPTPTNVPPTPYPTFFIQSNIIVTDDIESNEDLSNTLDQDSINNRALIIKWNMFSNYDLPELTDIHIYVKSSQDNQFRFLGRTGNGSISYFEWNDNNPLVRNQYLEGPKFGEKYIFQVFFIRPGINSFFGPFVNSGPVTLVEQNQ